MFGFQKYLEKNMKEKKWRNSVIKEKVKENKI